MNVMKFRPYKVDRVRPVSDFLGSPPTSKFNKDFASRDLSKSGLTLEDISGFAQDNLILVERATAGYLIPYWSLDGNVIFKKDGLNAAMYRIKLEFPPYDKAQRYTQPASEDLLSHGLPSFLPYLYPCEELASEVIYCCEGEKKTASFVKHLQLPAFGIAGCHMWKNPAGTGGVHPWILEYLHRRGVKKVVIVPDGDVFKYDICAAYGTYAHALLQAGYEVELLNPPHKIDDLIVGWGNDAREQLAEVPKLQANELVQSPGQLAIEYDLAFKRVGSKSEKLLVHQHSSNVMRLLRSHKAFPNIWLNRDTNELMFADKAAIPDKTEMDVANHMQHNFGLEKVTAMTIRQCMRALSKENERSPMLDFIKEQHWDGRPRLDTWMVDTWGVADSPYVREVSAKWLMSACARMDKPGSKVDWMLIVIGAQGTGKTSMPGIVFCGNAVTLYGDQSDKDLHLKLHSALVVGFDELDSFSRKDASLLKAMITNNVDQFRPPYGASIETFPRRFTLYGCGNRSEFLQDDATGHRRYAVIEVPRKLDFAQLESIVPQLWAEAWSRYSLGGDWWEVQGASEEAQKYVIQSPLADLIEGTVEALMLSKGENYQLCMADILQSIGDTQPNSGKSKEISGILQKMGYKNRVIKQNKKTKRIYTLDD